MTPFGWQHAKVKSTKSTPPLKVAKSGFMGTLFEQPPQTQIRPKAKYLCVYQIANDKTIILSTENVQKVHSRPKLWVGWSQSLCGGARVYVGSQSLCGGARVYVVAHEILV